MTIGDATDLAISVVNTFDDPALPFTGEDARAALVAGGLLVVTGALLVLWRRRRNGLL